MDVVVDYPNKRIHLPAETMGAELDTLDVYRSVREQRATTEAHRAFLPIIEAGGNIPKTETTATQPYVRLLHGCRIVPYDVSHRLTLTRDTFTDDGAAGAGCFDFSLLSPGVVVGVDVVVDKVEVREVSTGGVEPEAIAVAVQAALQDDFNEVQDLIFIK